MTDLPSPERRAELRGLPGRDTLTDAELTALLDATEPVEGGAAAKLIISLIDIRSGPAVDVACKLDALCLDAAALLARLARELAEARGKRVRVDRVAHIPFGPPENEDE
jgi:hypothetical protein